MKLTQRQWQSQSVVFLTVALAVALIKSSFFHGCDPVALIIYQLGTASVAVLISQNIIVYFPVLAL